MKHFTITFKPDSIQISVHSGTTLLEAAGRAGIILNSVCGGRGTCKKCTVLLEPGHRAVCACQYRIDSDLTVTIPRESRFFGQKIQEGSFEGLVDVKPDVFRKYQQGDPAKAIFGIAVDLGTTTIVAKLMDMVKGKTLASAAALNPQTRFGDDVISRITYARGASEMEQLHKCVIGCLNQLIARLCLDARVEAADVYEMCVVGNTTMNHIFLKLPIAQLGQAPYEAYSLGAHDLSPPELGLEISPEGNVHTVENVAGFVGSDTVAVALAVDIGSSDDTTLIVDVGTNGEVVLGSKEALFAASCAAGPAFEGARIACGSRAAEGAIQGVAVENGEVLLDVIDAVQAQSICGSGLIDAVSVLLQLGVIDRSGRFVRPDQPAESLPPGVAWRVAAAEGQPAFILAKGERPVFLSQKDVREAQLAKAAIRTGIKLLQDQLSVQDGDIERVYLAGAFGNYISRDSALRIGLLPDVQPQRVRSVGNAALVGAQMALVSEQYRQAAGKLARKIQYVEIANQPRFQDVFAEALLFPP